MALPPTKGGIDLLIWTIVFTIVDGLFVFLRFWAAHLVKRRIYADDYLIVFALINSLALEGVVIWVIFAGGMGHLQSDLSPTELQVAFKSLPACQVPWTLGTTAFKLSVLSLYTRIFSIKLFKHLSYALMFISVAYCISFLAVFLATCSPDISQLWNPRPDGYCRDMIIGELGSVSTNLIIDILIIILPMPFLWNLNMRLRNKITVSTLFSLGFITIGIMIWRIVDLVENSSSDFVYNMPTLALTTTLELWICIIIACIPTLAPIAKTYLAPILSKLSESLGSSDARTGPLSIVTFGRLGGPRRKNYTTMTYGSQDPISNDVETGGGEPRNISFREDAFTTSYITSVPRVEGSDIGLVPLGNTIRVQQDIDTYKAPKP